MSKAKRTTSIGAKIQGLLAVCVVLVAAVVGGIGYHGMGQMSASMGSIYNDRVVPLEQLKKVADAYAVKIVDTTHKLRPGRSTAAGRYERG